MKKFLAILLILVLLGGTAFFFGWVSFRIDGDEYAVAFTKSDGWITEPVQPGEFRWMWHALIPTNLTLHRFSLSPSQLQVDESATLPSAELYRRYVEGEPSFEYSLAFTLAYRVKPTEVAKALAREQTTPDSIDSYIATLEGRITNHTRSAVVSAVEDLAAEPAVDAVPKLSQDILSSLRGTVPELELLSLTISEALLPDPFVYKTAQENYQAIQEGRQEGLRETARNAATQRVLEGERREALEEYGRILQEYPVLLDYFRLSAERGTDPLNLGPLQSVIEEAEE